MRKMMLTSLSLFLGLTLMATAAMSYHDGNKEPLVISELGPKNFSGPPL